MRPEQENFITSDINSLRKVLVHPLGAERRHIVPRFGFVARQGFSADLLGAAAEQQHKIFTETLSAQGVKVISTYDLINNALANLKKEGRLERYIEEHFPKVALLLKETGELAADDLIGASDRAFYRFFGTKHAPASRPLSAMFFTRDLAVTVPEGIVLTSFNNKRSFETKLVRLMFDWSDQLHEVPIVFDAEREHVHVQGGDIIVHDEKTLFMGVDNASERAAASLMAKKLNKMVIAVKLPSPKSFLAHAGGSLGSLMLHLDTVFNIVDTKKALVMPYFFENAFADQNPLYSIVGGAVPAQSVRGFLRRGLYGLNEKRLRRELAKVGTVTIFEAGSGKEIDTSLKLVDFLKSEFGYEIIFVGGTPPTLFEDRVKHIVEVVIPETHFQAGNVFALRPGEVLIYKENTEYTQQALHKAGIKIILFEGYELARWRGGPHCMTMPLKRRGQN